MLRVRQVSGILPSVTDTSILTSIDGTTSIPAATSPLSSETTLPSTSSLASRNISLCISFVADTSYSSHSSAQPTTTLPTTTPTSNSPTSTAPSSTPISSSSTLSPTPSSISSTSPLPSTTTTPPGIPTTITSSYVTVIGGSTYTTQSLIASVIPTQSSSNSDQRAAIIGGSAAGGAVLLIIVVSIIFFLRRKHFKRLRILDAIMSTRKQAQKRAMLLAGEDMDDDFHPPPSRYRDYETPWDVGSPHGSMSMHSFVPPGSPGLGPQPSIFPSLRSGDSRMGVSGAGTVSGPSTPPPYHSHRSESGSMFREEVWPPPNERSRLIDPLARSHEVDLGSIVNDVMGTPAGPALSEGAEQQHRSNPSLTPSMKDEDASREALLKASGLGAKQS
ncbi:hypothetical protein F5141DRAFT_1264362 [Pisolithus sp. B1]|nr:hypothetical protein F5141DRAFT_1264362 [Pisolithus sp. B1]